MLVRNVSFLGNTFVAINTKMEESEKIPNDLLPTIVEKADSYKDTDMPVVFADHKMSLFDRARELLKLGARNVHLAAQNFNQIFNDKGQLLVQDEKNINKGKPVPYTKGEKINSPRGGAYSDHTTLPYLMNEIKIKSKSEKHPDGYDLKYVFIGHPEVKGSANFNETPEKINLKVREALDQGLSPILFITNSAADQASNTVNKPIIEQLETYLKDVNLEKHASKINISYTPDLAITDAKDVNDRCVFIKKTIAEMANNNGKDGEKVKKEISVGYANSVDETNAQKYADQPDLDFVVLGGAGINVEKAPKIIQIFAEKARIKREKEGNTK